MNNSQIAHLWANQSRESARGSNFYFECDTIYSYGAHLPIARHYKGVILFTSGSYSVTTAKHKSEVRQAISHKKTFTVERPQDNPSGKDVKNYADSIKSLSEAVSRARDPEWKLKMLQREVDEANDFCATFGFKTRFFMPDEKTLSELKQRSLEATKRKAAATAKRNARIERENAELITRWLAGESVSLPYNLDKVYLRVNKCSRSGEKSDLPCDAVMETTKRATVPLPEAEKAFRFAMLKRETGWHRNGETFRIGDFQLDAVNEQGVIAGCHRVTWAEIERFATLQGWMK